MSLPGIVEVDPASWPGHRPLVEIASASAIVALVQLNVVEFHTANAAAGSFDKPDRLVFDLDPGEGLPWRSMIEGAILVKTLLDELGLASFVKTSGGKGLHLVVPLLARHSSEEVKAFATAVAHHIARTIPERFVATSGPRNRVGKIYIDYLRNSHSATTVAAFSARARPGLGVSMPIAWEELPEVKSGAFWTVATAPARIEEVGRADPWAAYARARRSLGAASRRLGR